jgi:type IV pilus assembly protein PilM
VDEHQNELPIGGEPEQGDAAATPAPDYTWGQANAESDGETARAWTESGAEPVEGPWAAPLPEPPPTTLRPAWAPTVWEPAAPAVPATPPESASPVQPPVEAVAPAEAPVEQPAPVEVIAPLQAEPVEQPAPIQVIAPVQAAPVDEPAAVEVPRVEVTPVEQPAETASATEASPVEEPAAESTSFLKKEISFRRKPKSDAPKAEQSAKAERPAGGSFLKKDISFGRKPKSDAPKAEQSAKAEKSAGGSFLKKDISFGRKAKSDAPKAEKAKAEKSAGGSFLKKDISFGRKPKSEKPKSEKPKSEKSKAATSSGRSFLKMDISFGGISAAKRTKGRNTPSEGRAASTTHKKLVGLKIGSSQLAAARVANNGSAQLVQVARGPLASGIVVGGELRDPDALSAALKEFFAKNKLPKRGVRLGLANNRIGVRVFELEGIEDSRQLANAIRFRAQDALPIPIDEAVLDYQVLGERVDEDGKTVRRVLLVVAYRELIDRYVAACRKAGIQLVGIDLEAFALLRALSDAQPEQAEDTPPAALVAVSIGHDRSTFAVSDGRVCEFTRVLEWGGGTLDVAVARALDLAPSEAEPFKRELGLEGDGTPEGLSDAQATVAREAIRREIQTFARELVSSLQFYQNQPGSLGIAEIVVTGGTAHLVGLAEQLQKLIGVRVRVGDPLAHVRTGKRLKGAEQIGSLTVAIGLGVER